MILDKIVADVAIQLEKRKKRISFIELAKIASKHNHRRLIFPALYGATPSVSLLRLKKLHRPGESSVRTSILLILPEYTRRTALRRYPS